MNTATSFRFTVQTPRGLKNRWFATYEEALEFWNAEHRWVKSWSAPEGYYFTEPRP